MSIYHSKKKSRPQILFDKSQENSNAFLTKKIHALNTPSVTRNISGVHIVQQKKRIQYQFVYILNDDHHDIITINRIDIVKLAVTASFRCQLATTPL